MRTAAKLDYEMTPSVEFRVIAIDLGKPQQTSEVAAVVHIDVVDVNDCPPEFTLNEYNVDVLLPTYDNVRILQVCTENIFKYKGGPSGSNSIFFL